MNILKGRLNQKEMSKFMGVESQKVDKSLACLAEQGYIKYRKIKGGKYKFTLYPKPVKELGLRNS